MKKSARDKFQNKKILLLKGLKKKKTARDNFRKSAREIKKVPVTNFGESGVTGTLGCHGKKKHWPKGEVVWVVHPTKALNAYQPEIPKFKT